MAVLLRFAVLIPLIFSFVAFVLTNLTLFAGSKKGFMEEYAVVRINTTMLGQNILSSDEKSSNDDDDDGESLWDQFTDGLDDLGDAAKGKINDIAGDIIGDIADELGISDWYSLHVMNACWGGFGPNATASHFQLNTTNCTTSAPQVRFNLTSLMDHQLSLGPLHISLAKIHWPGSIQLKIDALNAALMALFVLYVLGVGFSGLAMLACIPAIVLGDKRILLMVNTGLASLAAFFITIASIVATAAGSVAVNAINTEGKPVTVVATNGTKFYTITWVTATLMILSSLFWIGKFVFIWKKEKKERERYSKEGF
ncbi:actin cortical patch SUR7/pH-response regulator pali [Trichoderma sp. SZMC 28015]